MKTSLRLGQHKQYWACEIRVLMRGVRREKSL
jgi:hypothetical protein